MDHKFELLKFSPFLTIHFIFVFATSMMRRTAIWQNQIFRVIINLTEETFSPIRIATVVKSSLSDMKKAVIGMIFTNYQIFWPIIISYAVYMMNLNIVSKIFSNNGFGYKTMFKNIPPAVGPWMFLTFDKDIPIHFCETTFPTRVSFPFACSYMSFPLPIMVIDIVNRFSFYPTFAFDRSFWNGCFQTTTAFAITIRNFIHICISFCRNYKDNMEFCQGMNGGII